MQAHKPLKKSCRSVEMINIKKSAIAASAAAAIVLGGCSTAEIKPSMNKAAAEVRTPEAGKNAVSLSVSEMSVRKIIKSVCDANSLSCDFSAQPSDKYIATFSYNGDVSGLLGVIKRQTGLNYRMVDGMIVLDNKDEITLYVDPLKKSACTKEMTVSFKNIGLAEAFKYFYDEFGFSFSFDTRYTQIAAPLPKTSAPAAPIAQPEMPVLATADSKAAASTGADKTSGITFFYNGCDPREALKSFLSTVDMSMVEARDREFRIKDYEITILDKSVYFDYKMSSGGSGNAGSSSGSSGMQTTGTATGSSGGQGASGSTSTTSVSFEENHQKDMEQLLKNYLSESGKLDFSTRGYVIVEDKPSHIKRIEKIVKKEIEKEMPLAISINIVRIDLNDNYKAGVDWNAVWQNGLFGLRDLRVTSSMSALVGGGFSVTGAFKGTDQVLTMLQDYGTTKIERSSTITARSGFLANYEATKPIPYIVTASTVAGDSGLSQLEVTPLYEQEGFTLNILPNVNMENKTIDLGVDVTVAEYAGDKVFDLGAQGTYTFPIVPKDKGKFAVQAKLGETVILTGFKVKKDKTGRKGVPGLSQIRAAGALFGYQEEIDESSEILIILKVDQVNRG